MQISQKTKRILLITTSHVGNNIFCTPAIRLLKKHRPAIQLDLVAMSKRGAGVFVGNPDIETVYISTNKYRLRRLARNYDLIIAFHKDVATNYLAKVTNACVIAEPSGAQHRAETLLLFMQSLIACTIDDEDLRYVIAHQLHDDEQIKNYLTDCNTDYLVGLHLGCGRTLIHGWKFWYSKRDKDPRLWNLENYIELAQKLKDANPRIQIVITGSTNEKFLGKKFLKKVPDTIDLIGKTSIQSLAALMRYLRVFVTQDTGPLHVACSTDIPIVGLYGPTSPEVTGPYRLRPQHTIIKKQTISEITTDEVYKAILKCLI
jgi:ADP-heptose:LPS heptosyltransferase